MHNEKLPSDLKTLIALHQIALQEVRKSESDLVAAHDAFKRASAREKRLAKGIHEIKGTGGEGRSEESDRFASASLRRASYRVIRDSGPIGASVREIHDILTCGGYSNPPKNFEGVIYVTCRRLEALKLLSSKKSGRERRFFTPRSMT